jgi:hypothetical protein
MQAQIERLKQEVAKLNMKHDILKTQSFSRRSQCEIRLNILALPPPFM